MTAAQDSRAQFEAWYEANAMPAEADWFRRDPSSQDEYLHEDTRDAWKVWKASRAALSAEPVAYLVERHAFRASPDGQDAEGNSWLEECHPTEPGAFQVYAAPQPAAQERKPLTDAYIEVLLTTWPEDSIAFFDFARAIERAHGITGQRST